MGKTISLNMAIGEKKLLTERIEKLTRTIEIVKAKGKKAEAVGGVAIKDVETKLKSSYQQLTDLLDERDRLELAIVQKNAETVIEINGQKFTIAQALIRQKSIELKKEILRRLRENYEKETIKIDQANLLAEKEALAGINATNTAKGDLASNMKNAFDIIYDTKAMELLDPIGAVKEIEKLEKELLEFGSKLSYELTDINAITKIEY